MTLSWHVAVAVNTPRKCCARQVRKATFSKRTNNFKHHRQRETLAGILLTSQNCLAMLDLLQVMTFNLQADPLSFSTEKLATTGLMLGRIRQCVLPNFGQSLFAN